MFVFGVHPLELVARTAIVYVVFVAVLRVFGKRELGQESDGSISVVPRESDSEALRRRRLRTRHM
jgi:uncharacterized membrane protein YcaP (DUF421 family)